MVPELWIDLYRADPAQHLTTAGDELRGRWSRSWSVEGVGRCQVGLSKSRHPGCVWSSWYGENLSGNSSQGVCCLITRVVRRCHILSHVLNGSVILSLLFYIYIYGVVISHMLQGVCYLITQCVIRCVVLSHVLYGAVLSHGWYGRWSYHTCYSYGAILSLVLHGVVWVIRMCPLITRVVR